MTHECPTCGFRGVPLTHCAVCGTLIPGLTPPLSAEIDSLRAQLSVARAQTASDREYIAELREAMDHALAAMWDSHYGRGIEKAYAQSVDAYCRAVLGKVSP